MLDLPHSEKISKVFPLLLVLTATCHIHTIGLTAHAIVKVLNTAAEYRNVECGNFQHTAKKQFSIFGTGRFYREMYTALFSNHFYYKKLKHKNYDDKKLLLLLKVLIQIQLNSVLLDTLLYKLQYTPHEEPLIKMGFFLS